MDKARGILIFNTSCVMSMSVQLSTDAFYVTRPSYQGSGTLSTNAFYISRGQQQGGTLSANAFYIAVRRQTQIANNAFYILTKRTAQLSTNAFYIQYKTLQQLANNAFYIATKRSVQQLVSYTKSFSVKGANYFVIDIGITIDASIAIPEQVVNVIKITPVVTSDIKEVTPKQPRQPLEQELFITMMTISAMYELIKLVFDKVTGRRSGKGST